MTLDLRNASGAQRLGASVLVLGLWALVGWAVWELVWPGPPVALRLSTPPREQVLTPDAPLTISGRVQRVQHVRRLRCNGRRVRPDPGGGFRAVIPGPTRAGMYVVRCEGQNERGRWFPFAHARLAGRTAPLEALVDDAVVLSAGLDALLAPGGLLHRLQPATRRLLTDAVRRVARSMPPLTLRGARLGPLRVGSVSVLGVEAGGPHELRVRVGLRQVTLGLAVPRDWLPDDLPGPLTHLLPMLSGPKQIPLGQQLPLTVTFRWPPGRAPEVALGPLGTDELRQALRRYRFVADTAAELFGLFSARWRDRLAELIRAAHAPLRALDQAYRQVQARLGRLAALLPPLPASVSPQRPAACLGLTLSHLATDPRTARVRIHLSARVRGYTVGGHRCDDDTRLQAVPAAARRTVRLVQGPPRPGPPQPGPPQPGPPQPGPPQPRRRPRPGPPRTRATPRPGSGARAAPAPAARAEAELWIAHDLINAYLATLWAAGTLARVPVKLPELAEGGFDIRALRYGLPPVLTTTAQGDLRLEVPELGVDLGTAGEPRRLLSVHLRLPLSVRTPRPGRLRLAARRRAPPRIWVRCEREAGRACAAQSRRLQDLVDLATELAFRPELAIPELAVKAALPTMRAAGVTVEVTAVRPVPRGLHVRLGLRR